MDSYTRVAVAGEVSANYFTDTLYELAVFVGISPPTFRGKLLREERGLEKWEIKTHIPRRTADAEDQCLDYSEVYPDWDYSIDVAMQDAIARICHKYHDIIPRTSGYFQFGERTADGQAVERAGQSDCWSLIHRYMVEREFSATGMETMMRRQLAKIDDLQEAHTDMIRRVIHAQNLAEDIDDQRLELEKRIALLEDPLKMEEKMICSDVWAETLKKTLILTIKNRSAEAKKMENLQKEMEALKLENATLRETVSELTSTNESSSENNPRRKKRMTAPQYLKRFKAMPPTS